MSLVIETGTGAASSQAYASAAQYVTWATAWDGAAPTDTTAATEAAILRAVAYLGGLSWAGVKTFGRVQALTWPRAYAADADGWDVASTAIPAEVIEAQHMLTKAELASPGCLSPTVTMADQSTLIQLDVLGWAPGADATVGGTRATVTAALDRLKGFISSGARVLRA